MAAPVDRSDDRKVGSVLVVGAGIAGIQAALDLANAGFHVTLVERTSAIGGRMAQLDKTFPTNDCSMCTISPRLIEVDKHLNIDVLTDTEVLGAEGGPGDFRVRLLRHPRYVDIDKCNSCGDCLEVCPVSLPDEFNQGLNQRHAIYKRYPQAIPAAVAISKAGRAPCTLACPAGVNCQGYAALIAQRRFGEAYALIRERNPFPAICGRVCHHPCETECNRKQLDQAVAINPLKRFVADWIAERRASGEDPAPPLCGAIDPSKPKVAVIGGGPAGLTAARDLALQGFPVTLFEADKKLGGTLRQALPAFRLPDQALERDLAEVLAAGFEVRTGQALGREFSLSDLRKQGFAAVLLATGRGAPQRLERSTDGSPLQNADLPQVLAGLDFLRVVRQGQGPRLHGRVAVIGGGNVAIDAALCALRQGAQQVSVIALEQRDSLPAFEWELRQALDEGIELLDGWGVRRILESDGRLDGLELQRCASVFDEQGRFAPRFGTGQTRLQADWVISAIGQAPQLEFSRECPELLDADGRTLRHDPLALQTPLDWLFLAGDLAGGAASAIEAIAQGHAAAESIARLLAGSDLRQGREPVQQQSAALPEREFARVARARELELTLDQRAGWDEVLQTLDEETAVAEAGRCLACGLCSECGACVEVCEPKAIDLGMQPQEVAVAAGAIVLAPGYEPFDPRLRGEYGYGRYPNVVTSLEFERMLASSGPLAGELRRPSDNGPLRSVAWIQCVGSRDAELGNDYCSGVCCMYAIKEALLAVEHVVGLRSTIFHNDVRAFGKGFEAFYESAQRRPEISFVRSSISAIKQVHPGRELRLTFGDEQGRPRSAEFDLVVLSVGLRPSAGTAELAERLGLELDQFGFCRGEELDSGRTSRPGVFAAGAFSAPMDIPESVMSAACAASLAAEELSAARNSLTREREFPPERDAAGEEPRIGVFVCRCGNNISQVVDVPQTTLCAAGLPQVAYAEENLHTCSADAQRRIADAVQRHGLNRVVVASCSPRTHEALFQQTLREAGLNRHLFAMANIRDQCSWVHRGNNAAATHKAIDLVRMAAARAAALRPILDLRLEVDQRALVLGAGAAGLSAALSLADQGFPTALIEREPVAGGAARLLSGLLRGPDPRTFVAALAQRAAAHPLIDLRLNTRVTGFSGRVGAFRLNVERDGQRDELGGGALIVATGAAAYQPDEYGCGANPAVLSQLELEQRLDDPACAASLSEVAMIQCVGSRDEQHNYCSRVCCGQAVKNALRIKRLNPAAQVYLLYRDMRTYGLDELHYRDARAAGVLFMRFDPQRPPELVQNNGLRLRVFDQGLGRTLELRPGILALSAGIRPQPDAVELSRLLKLPLNSDGFFMEAHLKLRPLDFASDGVFLAGLAHAPKSMAESIGQARGAAARAATVIAQPFLLRSGAISEVDRERCAGCLTCGRVCPYDVPRIDEGGTAIIDPARCQGCGACASACPRQAIFARHYSDEQLSSALDALFAPAGTEAL